jgi:hypothetical protein
MAPRTRPLQRLVDRSLGLKRNKTCAACFACHQVFISGPYLNLDFVTNGLSAAMKNQNIFSALTHWELAEVMLPEMIRKIILHGNPYMIEGGSLDLETIAEIRDGYPADIFIVVFLGFPNARPEEKLQAIMSDPRTENEWLRTKPLSFVTAHIKEQIQVSRSYQARCERLGIEFCDTSKDIGKTVEGLAQAIARKVRPS